MGERPSQPTEQLSELARPAPAEELPESEFCTVCMQYFAPTMGFCGCVPVEPELGGEG